MSKLWLLVSAAVAGAGLFHAATGIEAAAARDVDELHAARRDGVTTQCAVRRHGRACPYAEHDGLRTPSATGAQTSAGATCPFSSGRGPSSLSLEEAIELHESRVAPAAKRGAQGIWL